MARNWRQVRAEAAAAGLIDEDRVRRNREVHEAEVRAYRLGEVRRSQNLTQAQLAAIMGVSQPRVSQLERGDLDNTELATLRAYVAALGGRLRIVADFGDENLTVA